MWKSVAPSVYADLVSFAAPSTPSSWHSTGRTKRQLCAVVDCAWINACNRMATAVVLRPLRKTLCGRQMESSFPHCFRWLCSGWQGRSASGAEAVSRCSEDRAAVVRRQCVASAERSVGVPNRGFVPCGVPRCSLLGRWACCWLRRRRCGICRWGLQNAAMRGGHIAVSVTEA